MENSLDKQFLDIPWDCLTRTRKVIVKAYIYDKQDFKEIAKKLKLNNQSRAKLEFYYALTTLSEYGIMRKFIEANERSLTETQLAYLRGYYLNNLSLKEIADTYMVTRQAVQKTIKKVIRENGLKWRVFVRKNGNKVIYNTAELI